MKIIQRIATSQALRHVMQFLGGGIAANGFDLTNWNVSNGHTVALGALLSAAAYAWSRFVHAHPELESLLQGGSKTLPILLLCGLACMMPEHNADAANANVSWTLPTQYTDGSALAVSDLASTTVEYGTCNGTAFGIKAGQIVVNAPATSGVVTGLTPGAWCFRGFVMTNAAHGAQQSAVSIVVSKNVPWPAPNPPTLLDAIIAWLRSFFVVSSQFA